MAAYLAIALLALTQVRGLNIGDECLEAGCRNGTSCDLCGLDGYCCRRDSLDGGLCAEQNLGCEGKHCCVSIPGVVGSSRRSGPSPSPSSYVVKKTDITMSNYFSRTKPWTVKVSGTVATNPNTPRRMHSATCNDRFFMTWMAHSGTRQNPQYAQILDELSVGYISEFQISGGSAVLVREQKFNWCSEIGNIYVTSDCQLVATLCRTSSDAATLGAVDFVAKTAATLGYVPWGWEDPGRVQDHMVLMEWAVSSGTADITRSPTLVNVNNAIGSWDLGNWELQLNAARTLYNIDIKTTLSGHESTVNFAMNRPSWTYNDPLSAGWACGSGHVYGNRLMYNPAVDKFGRWCFTDFNYAETPGVWSLTFSTIPMTADQPVEVQLLAEYDGAFWEGDGGNGPIINAGTRGWIAVGTGTGGTGATRSKVQLGLFQAPAGGQSAWNANPKPITWMSSLGTGKQPIGYANLQRFGAGGDSSPRLLVGWAAGVGYGGVVSDGFYMAEVTESGSVVSSILNISAYGSGWGEDSTWSYMPSTGCVVWPYTWLGAGPSKGAGATGTYGDSATQDLSTFSTRLTITTVCPDTSSITSPTPAPQTPTPQPTPQPTPRPTPQPTSQPTPQPTPQPTRQPTRQPTAVAPTSSQPTTARPTTRQPTTSRPTVKVTATPTRQPTTRHPTSQPTVAHPTTGGAPTPRPTPRPTFSFWTKTPTSGSGAAVSPTAAAITPISPTSPTAPTAPTTETSTPPPSAATQQENGGNPVASEADSAAAAMKKWGGYTLGGGLIGLIVLGVVLTRCLMKREAKSESWQKALGVVAGDSIELEKQQPETQSEQPSQSEQLA